MAQHEKVLHILVCVCVCSLWGWPTREYNLCYWCGERENMEEWKRKRNIHRNKRKKDLPNKGIYRSIEYEAAIIHIYRLFMCMHCHGTHTHDSHERQLVPLVFLLKILYKVNQYRFFGILIFIYPASACFSHFGAW